jgi:adenylylsulfate kinase
VSGLVVWITGLPQSGKSTLARRLRGALVDRGVPTVRLDSDELRDVLRPPPGYGPEARDAFYETLAGVGGLLAAQGFVVIVPATAHRRAYRDAARARVPAFLEVWVDAGPDVCADRDGKGLYAKAAAGEIDGLPGVGVAYEAPERPDVVASGGHDEAALAALVRAITDRS